MARWIAPLLLIAAALLGGCATSPAPSPAPLVASGPPQSMLWVGNSFFYYNNSLHGHVGQLATSGRTPVRGTSVTISGSGMDWHDLASLLRPDGVGRYSFAGDNEIRFNPDAYTAAAKANGAKVIPAGLAFARAVAVRPDVDLYVADKRHPSLAGTYLAACTSYAALFGKNPVGLSYTAGLPADVARAMQTAAWKTVQAYQQP